MKKVNANTNSVLNRYSRFVHGGTSEVGGARIEYHERSVFPTDETDIVYVIERNLSGRPDMIASIFYDEPRYWWVIAQHNNILNPFSEMVTGRVIYVPTKQRLGIMLNGRQGGVKTTRQNVPLVPPIII